MSNEKTEKKETVTTATAAPSPEKQSQPKQQGQQQKQGQKNQPPKMSREQRTEQKIARQVDLVKSGNYSAVPRRALETNAAIVLLTKNDFLVDRLRDRLVSDPTIDIEKGIAALKKNQEIREELNALNAEICALMGMEYEAPRGFELANNDGKDSAKAA